MRSGCSLRAEWKPSNRARVKAQCDSGSCLIPRLLGESPVAQARVLRVRLKPDGGVGGGKGFVKDPCLL